MSDEQPQKTIITYKPFTIVDIAIGDVLDKLIDNRADIRRRWNATTAGSSLHRLVRNDDVVVVAITARNIAPEDTIRTVFAGEMPRTQPDLDKTLIGILALIEQEIANIERWAITLREARPKSAAPQPTITTSEFSAMIPTRKRRGPDPKSYNAWARDQARNGRRLDDPNFLEEYMQQRGADPTDTEQRERAREALRKTIERDQKL